MPSERSRPRAPWLAVQRPAAGPAPGHDAGPAAPADGARRAGAAAGSRGPALAGWPAERREAGRGRAADGHPSRRARRGGGRSRPGAERRRGHRAGNTGRGAGGARMTVTREASAVPDSTEPTISLLRELRRGRARRQAASAAYWIYLVALLAAVYGGAQIASAFRALRHPPLPSTAAPRILDAAPAGLAALALLVLLVLLRDALWRGPVTLPQVTVDWLLDTPVDRGRLLRPRFRMSAAVAVAAGAAVGIVPAAALVALGLGGRSAGHVLRLTGIAMASAALLFALGTGAAGLIERYPACERRLRQATPVAAGVAAAFAGLALWAALGQPP